MAGTVLNPTTVSQPFGTSNVNDSLGKQGDMLASEIHGKWYTAAYNGRLFIAAPLIAGVTIPVNTTTSPTFTLFNPTTSSVNLELVEFSYATVAAGTSVIGTILGSISRQTPTSTTSAANIFAMPTTQVASTTSTCQAQVFTAATITAITSHIPLVEITATTAGPAPMSYQFDGKVVLAPGTLITITSSPVQTQASMPCISWVEWPV